ncbi:MAG TPA: MFS transporter [Armatimonadota bacterium]|nr:MFS transporter [Armatimonadota bacterium]
MALSITTLRTRVEDPAQRASIRVAIFITAAVILNSLVGMFSGEKMSFLFKEVMGLSASQVATLGIITGIPGYLRPFMGAASDFVPILGYHRRAYFAISWILTGLGFLGLTILHQYHVSMVVCLVLVTAAGGNLLYVIMDAVMVAIGNETGTIGRLQSLQQFLPLGLGIAFVASTSGYVTQHWSYGLCFGSAAGVAFLGVLLTPLINEKRQFAARQKHETEEDHAARMAARAAERARIREALGRAARSPGLWAMVGFVFYLIITPGTGLAQFYYSVDVLHFDKQFIGNLGRYGSAGAIVAMLLFASLSRKLPVRAMIWGAYLMDCSLYLVSMGLHDKTSGMVIAFALSLLGMIYNLCLLTVAARACPPGIEGTIYGLVIAAITLAGALGEKMGSSIYDYFGPSHHYPTAHGWFTLLWFGFAFTVIAVVFIPFLPEWTKSSEPITGGRSIG